MDQIGDNTHGSGNPRTASKTNKKGETVKRVIQKKILS